VSSAAIQLTSLNTRIALALMSSKLPIGVGTIYKVAVSVITVIKSYVNFEEYAISVSRH